MDVLVVMSGHTDAINYMNDIYTSIDGGINWVEGETPPWPARHGAQLIRTDIASDPTKPLFTLIAGVGEGLTRFSDIWQTRDSSFAASSWVLVSDGAFPPRDLHCAAVLDEGQTIVVWGGDGLLQPDTWISTNGGVNFTSPGGPAYGETRFAAVCYTQPAPAGAGYTETLWMVSGRNGKAEQTHDLWFSRNRGVDWQQYGQASFPPRSYAAGVYGQFQGLQKLGIQANESVFLFHGGLTAADFPSMNNDSFVSRSPSTFLAPITFLALPPVPESGRSGHIMLLNSTGFFTLVSGQIQDMPSMPDMHGMETGDVWLFLGVPDTPAAPIVPDDPGPDPGSRVWLLIILLGVPFLIVSVLVSRYMCKEFCINCWTSCYDTMSVETTTQLLRCS